MVLACFQAVKFAAVEGMGFLANLLAGGSGEVVHFRYLKSLRDFSAEIKRVGVIVCVWMGGEASVEPALQNISMD